MAELVTSLSAAAANVPGCGFDCTEGVAFDEIFASIAQGAAILPVALLVVWLTHRSGLNRWIAFSALLATLISFVVAYLLEANGFMIGLHVDRLMQLVGVRPFNYLMWPALLLLLFGSGYFAFWLKRDRHQPDIELN